MPSVGAGLFSYSMDRAWSCASVARMATSWIALGKTSIGLRVVTSASAATETLRGPFGQQLWLLPGDKVPASLDLVECQVGSSTVNGRRTAADDMSAVTAMWVLVGL